MPQRNELPLRHLFQHLDGQYSGPREFSGPIERMLESCIKLSLANFEKRNGCLPAVPQAVSKDFSTDQKYPFEIWHAVVNGDCLKSLVRRNPVQNLLFSSDSSSDEANVPQRQRKLYRKRLRLGEEDIERELFLENEEPDENLTELDNDVFQNDAAGRQMAENRFREIIQHFMYITNFNLLS
ncbi:unnamed protein product [Psylliodes chrysocephalus]|uniref:Uncharacterized protein n=1 Tax=Psylliodes chrysocephalus TaxID=3402493 RepID=A0A9P0G6D3_9CUCU|nr:unnamed protein product [Psylliodes chrysocephala]